MITLVNSSDDDDDDDVDDDDDDDDDDGDDDDDDDGDGDDDDGWRQLITRQYWPDIEDAVASISGIFNTGKFLLCILWGKCNHISYNHEKVS